METIVGPVYRKVEGKPFEILQAAYRKVEDAIVRLESHVPPSLKSRTWELYGAVKWTNEAAMSILTNIPVLPTVEKTKEVANTLYVKSELGAKNLYNKYEPIATELSLSAWYKLRQVTVVLVVEVLIPPTAYCVAKYNSAAHYLSDGKYWDVAPLILGFLIFLIPMEKIKNSIYQKLEMKQNTGS